MRLFTVDVDFENMREKKDRFTGQSIKDKKKVKDREKKDLLHKIFET